jgi:formylglycine-generating enzyme required for sulfatase activity
MQQRDLFISHSSADAATAVDIVAEFERKGITCWIAPRDVPLGGTYQVELYNAITQCRAMLLLFSEAANSSEHVLREVEIAAEARKPIYPLLIDGVTPSGGLKYMLANKQWVERRALGDRLVATIEQLLRSASPADQATAAAPARTAPPAPARPTSPMIWIAAATVAAIVAGGVVWLLMNRPGPQQTALVAPPAKPPTSVPAPAKPPPHAPSAEPGPTPPTPQTVTPTTQAPAKPIPTPTVPTPTVVQPAQAPRLPNGEKSVILTSLPADLAAVADGRHFLKECSQCPVMAIVPAGQGVIGSPADEPGRSANEGPQQKVVFKRPFAISRSEVTFDEWFACVAEGGCEAYRPGDYGWGTGKHPVINVSWKDAQAYVRWLSHKTGAQYRLPSEAEWEYAARGCKSACPSTAFWFGNEITPERANYDWRYSYEGSPRAQALRHTVAADSGEMNPFGLLNVHGNVREWVEDCWNDTLAGLPADGSARATGDCRSRVVRGGSWADEPKDVRSAARSWDVLGDRRAEIGFRVARSFGP